MQGWNKEVVTRLGVDLMEGITEYFSGEYTRWRGQPSFTKLGSTLNIVKTYFRCHLYRAVEVLAPIMTELQSCIQGSWAQKDVFRQILLDACIRSDDDDDDDKND